MKLPDRITLWILEDEHADLEYFGKVDVGGAATLEALRVTFEVNDIVEWPFEFWDFEDKCHIRKKLERVNAFAKEVHVIWLEGDDDKRLRLADGSFTVTIVEVIAARDKAPEFLEIDVDEEEPIVLPIGSSRVSGRCIETGEVENNLLKSQLLPKDVMDRYLE